MTSYSDSTPIPPYTSTGGRRFPLRIVRRKISEMSLGRLVMGGRIADAGRLPRYIGLFLLGAAAVWAPITGYLKTAPLSFTSEMSLILPGSGSNASVNLSEIGQASSFADSAFASPSVSPTVTYKRLIGADRIVVAAADRIGQQRQQFGNPRVELIDQTGLIKVAVKGGSPELAREKGDALLAAFFDEIDKLRRDELDVRDNSGEGALADYRTSVTETRREISQLQRESGLISLGQYETLVDEVDAVGARVEDLAATVEEKSLRVSTLTATLGITARQAAVNLRLHADTEFASLVKEMSEHAAEFAAARGQYGARHPKVLAAQDAQAAAQQAALNRAKLLTSLEASEIALLDLSPIGERATLLAELVQMDAALAGKSAELAMAVRRLEADRVRVTALLEPAARLEDLQRDFQVAEAVLASASARKKSSKTDLYASYPLVQVLENPSLPVEPTSPKRKLAIVAGIAATMMIVMGLMLAWVRRSMIEKLLKSGKPLAA